MSLSDQNLLVALNLHLHQENPRYNTLFKLFPYIEKELKRTGVTLQLLWQEYREGYPDGYGYSQYCHHFYQWRKAQKVSMHIEHKAGDKLTIYLLLYAQCAYLLFEIFAIDKNDDNTDC